MLENAAYIVLLLVTASGLSIALAGLPRVLPLPLASRVAFAISLTPYLVGYCTTLLLFVPGVPKIFAMSAPGLLAAGMGFVVLRRSPRLCIQMTDRTVRAIRLRLQDNVQLMIGLAALCVVGFLVYVLSMNGSRPIIGHDAQIYLGEAKSALALTFPGSFEGVPQQSDRPPTHPHTGLFTDFLAHALLFMPDEALRSGFTPVRLSFQFTFLCLILAIVGLVALARRPGLGLLAISGFLLFPFFEYISSSQSRDAFRLTPMILLIALFTVVLARRRWSWPVDVGMGIAALLAIHGHTLNLYFMVLCGLVFVLAALTFRIRFSLIARLGLVAGLITMPALAHYVQSYLLTGNLLGEGMNYLHMEGTPLMQAMLADRTWSQSGAPFLESILITGRLHGIAPSVIALIALILGCVCVLHEPRRIRRVLLLFCATLAILFLLVPLSNLIRAFTLDLKEAFLANARYSYVVFVLGGPLIVLGIGSALNLLAAPTRRMVLALVAFILAIGAIQTLRNWPLYRDISPILQIVEADSQLCAIADLLPEDSLWLTDRYSIAYRCRRQPVFLYSPVGRSYFAAESLAEARAELTDTKVGLVSLSNLEPGWWPTTTFGQVLAQLVQEGTAQESRLRYWKVYRLTEISGSSEVSADDSQEKAGEISERGTRKPASRVERPG